MVRILLILGLVALVFWVRTWFSAAEMRKRLAKRSRAVDDPVVCKYLARLAAAAEVDEIRIRVITAPEVNALVTPTGEIYMTTGLYQKYLAREITAEELTSVVAHELGHVALGHAKRRMIDLTGAQIGQVLLGSVLVRFIPFIGWWLAIWLTSLFVAKLSRKDEFEADAFGAALMIRAGFGAEPQARMLEKLMDFSPLQAGRPPAWMASHPDPEERARRIRELEKGVR